MSDWKIRKRKDGCVRCEREFEEEEAFYSCLLIESVSIAREDRCIKCFDPTEVQEDVKNTIFWRTHRPPQGKRRLAVDFDVVEQIFFALADHDKERILELRYLMSLLLLRKKRLKIMRVVRNDDGEAMVLRRPRRTEAIEVRVFDLSEERSLQLREELTRIFEGADVEDLLAAPAPPPPAPEPPGEAEGPAESPAESPEAGPQKSSEADGDEDPGAVDSHETEERAAG